MENSHNDTKEQSTNNKNKNNKQNNCNICNNREYVLNTLTMANGFQNEL